MIMNFWLISALIVNIIFVYILYRRSKTLSRKNRSLIRQVSELKSMLSLNEDGILLLDHAFRVVTVNEAFANMVDLCHEEMVGKTAVSWPQEASIISRLGFSREHLLKATAAIQYSSDRTKDTIVYSGPPDRHLERTLCPVYNADELSGWLVMLHDITETRALTQMRQDMTHMLVHDLRSPLSVMLGSLETLQLWLENGRSPEIDQLFHIAQSSGQRLLGLLNDLLDMYKLESGELALYPEPSFCPHDVNRS